jgi:hypothetical protein
VRRSSRLLSVISELKQRCALPIPSVAEGSSSLAMSGSATLTVDSVEPKGLGRDGERGRQGEGGRGDRGRGREGDKGRGRAGAGALVFASDGGLGYNEMQRKTSDPLAMPRGIR